MPQGPPGPPPAAADFLSSSLSSATRASVVSIRPAIEAAFCRARRGTFGGEMAAALATSAYLPEAALQPQVLTLDSPLFSHDTTPSCSAVRAVWRAGSSTALV